MKNAANAKRLPTTLRGQQTRRHLLTAAEQVFGERGYGFASVAEIARRAGVALGTFYVYFPNKEALFLDLVDDLGERLNAYVASRMETASGRLERQRISFRAFFDFAAQHRHLYRLVRQAEDLDAVRFKGYYLRLAKQYATQLEHAMNEGDVARFEPEVLAWMLMGVADLVGMRFVAWEEGSPDIERVYDEVVRFIEAGLRAPARAPSSDTPSHAAPAEA